MVVPAVGALPLLRTTGRFAFVDDDKDYLDVLSLSLPGELSIDYFVGPQDFPKLDAALARTKEALFAEQDALMQLVQKVADRHTGASEAALEYFAKPDRLRMFIGLFTDYSMPHENGVSISARHRVPGLQRTLLTGEADEATAIEAFNAKAIDSYMKKAASGLKARLTEQFAWQLATSGARRGEILGRGLDTELRDALSVPATVDAINQLLATHGVAEYMVLGNPQGILCVREDAKVIWFQLETAKSFADLAQVLAEYEWAADVCERVKAHRSIVSYEIMEQLGKTATEQPAVVLSAEPLLSAAVFAVDDLPDRLRPTVRSADLAQI